MSDLDLEERLMVEKYLTLMKVLLKMAEDYLNGLTSEIDIALVEEVMKEQTELLNRLVFK